MRRSLASTVPEFRVGYLGEDSRGEPWLEVTCPRRECGGTFHVDEAEWREGRALSDTVGDVRPCPYCMRVARVPT